MNVRLGKQNIRTLIPFLLGGLLVYCFFMSSSYAFDDLDLDLTAEEKRWLKSHHKIRLGVDPSWPPYDYIDSNGEHRGFAADIIAHLRQYLNIEIELVANIDWSHVLEAIKKKEIDLISLCSPNSDAEQYLLFSDQISTAPWVVATRQNLKLEKGLRSLYKKRVVVAEGYAVKKTLALEHPELTIIETETPLDALKQVFSGKADAYIGYQGTIVHLIREQGLYNLHVAGSTGFTSKGLSVCIRSDWPELLTLVNKGLKSLSREQLWAIEDRWMPKSLNTVTTQKKISLTQQEQAWLKQQTEISLLFNQDIPPYFQSQSGGVFSGYAVDVVNMIMQRTGLNFSFQSHVNDGQPSERPQQSTIDVLALKTVAEGERLLTKPYIQQSAYIYKRVSDTKIKSLKDIQVQRIAMLEQSPLNQPVLQTFKQVSPIYYADRLQALNAVALGHADIFIGLEAMTNIVLDENKIENVHGMYRWRDNQSSFAFAVRSDWPLLISILNKALDSISEQEWQVLQNKWIPVNARKNIDQSLVNPVTFDQMSFLLKKLLMVLVAYVGVIFTAWLLKGRPSYLTIAETLFLVCFVYSGLIVAIGVFVSLLLRGQNSQQEIESRKIQIVTMALEFKQSTENLNRFAVSFAATGNPRYEELFNQVIAIRNGTQAHPGLSSDSYWDHVLAGTEELDQSGPTYALEKRINALNLSEKEKIKVTKIHKEAVELIQLETRAIHAAKGLFQGDAGKFVIRKKPDMEQAKQILHSYRYYLTRSRMLKQIDALFDLLDRRTGNQLVQVKSENETILLVISILTLFTLAFSLYVYLILKHKIVYPLKLLQSGTERISDGQYSKFITIDSKDEVGNLAQAFNAMSKSIEDRTSRLRSIIDTALDGIIVISDQGVLLEFSPAAEKIFGYGAEELIGLHVSVLIPDYFEAQPVEENHNRLIAKLCQKKYTLTARRRTNQAFSAELSMAQAEVGDQRIYTGIIRDITEQLEMIKAMEQARLIAEEATRTKSEFLANISHEIRTPMNAIIGLSYLSLQTELNLKQQQYLNIIHTAANSLLTLINDILDFSKIEADKLELEQLSFNLNEVLDNLVNLVLEKVKEKKLALLIDLDNSIPLGLVGDAFRLNQILINLVNNAIKFTDEGEIILKIEGRASTKKRISLKFSVIDSGIGLSHEQSSKLFNSFSQADTSTTRKYGGSGLGLSICKRLVELMGGKIWLHSEPGKGSTFCFEIELEIAEKWIDKACLPHHEYYDLPVLIIDKNPRSATILQNMLENISFKVDCFQDLESAKQTIQKHQQSSTPIKLVYWDVSINGWDQEAIRKDLINQGLQQNQTFIVSSAYEHEAKAEMFEQENIILLAKPVTMKQLIEISIQGLDCSLNLEHKQHNEISQQDLEVLEGSSVLVIDNDRTSLKAITELLELIQIEVTTAEQGVDALSMIEAEKYDLVLLDLKLSEYNSFMLIQDIRKLYDYDQLPLIVMVENRVIEENDEGYDQGINDQLSKPVQPECFYQSLIKWLAKSRNKITEKQHLTEINPILNEREAIVKSKTYKVPVFSGQRVLLADDNLANQLVAEELLQAVGLEVDKADNGKIAIECCRNQQYDLILMDIQMPEADGFQATNYIRKQLKMEQTPILAMTAHASREDRSKSIESGMNDHINKPIEPDSFYRTIQYWLLGQSEQERWKIKTPTKELVVEAQMLDVKQALKRLRGNESLYMRLLRNFSQKYQYFADELTQLLKEEQSVSSAEKIHALKGEAGTISATFVQKISLAIEKNIEQKQYQKAIKDSQVLEQELHELFRHIPEVIKQLAVTVKPVTNTISEESVDVISLIKQLYQHLLSNNIKAKAIAMQLAPAMQDSEIKQRWQTTETALAELDFELAADELLAVAGILNINLTES